MKSIFFLFVFIMQSMIHCGVYRISKTTTHALASHGGSPCPVTIVLHFIIVIGFVSIYIGTNKLFRK